MNSSHCEEHLAEKTSRRRLLILGLDGMTLDLVRPWAEAGHLPTFARLMREGAWGTLRSVIPPVSPTAWSSFLTGANPGQHGVYDFVGRQPGTYETWLANASRRSCPSLWGLLSRAGRTVTVFNVPLTYPPEEVRGLLVSGLLTPADAADGTWPRDLFQEIRSHVPAFNFSPPSLMLSGQESEFAQSIGRLNRTTLEVARFLMGWQPWDFCMAVFMGADILSHFLWRQMVNGQNTAIADCYRQLDAAVGELMEAAGPDVYAIVMSDHGFGPLERYFHVNTWLLGRGYLQIKRTPAAMLKYGLYRLGITRMVLSDTMRRLGVGRRLRRAGQYEDLEQAGLAGRKQETGGKMRWLRKAIRQGFLSFADIDWSRTQLFSLGFAGPLYVNLKGRDPEGVVEPGSEYNALLDQVTADLRALHDPETGRLLIGEIYRREQLYWGRHAAEAPDLTFLPHDWSDSPVGMLDFATNHWLTRVPVRSGVHRMEGIFFAKGPGIRAGGQVEGTSIMDVAPTALALLGVPIPATMDGHVLEEIMTPELRRSLSITYTQPPDKAGEGTSSAAELSQEEEEALRKHLRGLGYVA